MTCTYGPFATTGERCGAPAILTFGQQAECATHARVITTTSRVTHAFEPKPFSKHGHVCRICGLRDTNHHRG